ncbi:hypothetical protein UFOVP100_27 [uncultured Caudovirales phage]|uniref:Uncharacterized protein n=1 Tax=uncultured Caudovirales phage TaxID=2100421 RepID=A0A6J5L221_9CAUD|nr:hypothetical protein UFOVP100_27 [uncultured Caudovirales phage]
MNKGLWIARKNYLCVLIKQVSDGHGGDDIEFLRQHCREVIEAHPDELIEDAIACYTEMVEQLKYYPERCKK